MYWRRTMIAILACAPALFGPLAAAQSLPRDLGAWTVEYVVIGGVRGITRTVTVASNGSVVVQDQYAAEHVEGRVASEVVAKVVAFLKVARDEKPPTAPPIPDAAGVGLTATVGGRTYPLEATPEIGAVLNAAADAAVAQAVVGTWWQSKWTLCTPVPQLAADDVDLPIEQLVFDGNGGFSVAWRDDRSGAASRPRAPVASYRGRYSLKPQYGSIEVRLENGADTPRDFSGRGTLRINTNLLTLRGVWFGTIAARKRPDICELTFTRKQP